MIASRPTATTRRHRGRCRLSIASYSVLTQLPAVVVVDEWTACYEHIFAYAGVRGRCSLQSKWLRR